MDALIFEESDETQALAKWVSLAELDAKGLVLYPAGLADRLAGEKSPAGPRRALS